MKTGTALRHEGKKKNWKDKSQTGTAYLQCI